VATEGAIKNGPSWQGLPANCFQATKTLQGFPTIQADGPAQPVLSLQRRPLAIKLGAEDRLKIEVRPPIPKAAIPVGLFGKPFCTRRDRSSTPRMLARHWLSTANPCL